MEEVRRAALEGEIDLKEVATLLNLSLPTALAFLERGRVSDPGYLLDASALITPFYEGKLEALAKAFRFASRQVAQKHLEDWFEQGLKSRVLWLDTKQKTRS